MRNYKASPEEWRRKASKVPRLLFSPPLKWRPLVGRIGDLELDFSSMKNPSRAAMLIWQKWGRARTPAQLWTIKPNQIASTGPLNFLDLIFFFSPECAIHEVRSFPKKVNKLQQSHVLLLNRSSSLQRRGGTGQGTHSSQPTSNLLLQEMEWPEWGVWFQSNLHIFSQS